MTATRLFPARRSRRGGDQLRLNPALRGCGRTHCSWQHWPITWTADCRKAKRDRTIIKLLGAGMLGFPQQGSRGHWSAWIAALALSFAFLPLDASARDGTKQLTACQGGKACQKVPRVSQRCRWVKHCQTNYEHRQNCQFVQQCQSGHCMPTPQCFNEAVPYQTCYPRQVCQP